MKEDNKKAIKCILLIISICAIITFIAVGLYVACDHNSNTDSAENIKSDRFITVYSQGSGYSLNRISIYVDSKTRVQYLQSDYNRIDGGIGLTPLLDADGKPMLYDGELPEKN